MSKVLVVDDEKEIREIIGEVLSSKLLCKVEYGANGLEGFLKAKETKYDLIISDHKMPYMLGSALVVAIRTMENKNKDTPIVFLSAFISDELKTSLNIPNIIFVEKPFEEQKFIETLRDLLI